MADITCWRRGLRHAWIATATLWMAALPANAQQSRPPNDPHVLRAMNNVQAEMSTCVAFWVVTHQCLGDQDPPLSERIQRTIGGLNFLALETGRSFGMTEDAMMSRVSNARTLMAKEMQNNCINISSLLRQHAERCKQVTENTDSVLAEYMKRR